MPLATSLPRPFVLVQTDDQWLRCGHVRTSLDKGVIELAVVDQADASKSNSIPSAAAGLAFDAYCRLYHSLPEGGSVERLLWAAVDPLQIGSEQPIPTPLFAEAPDPELGDFRAASASRQPLVKPTALGVDDEDRLLIAESGRDRVVVYDLWSSRLLRKVDLGHRPVDLAVSGTTCWALTSPRGLVRFETRGDPVDLPLAAGAMAPGRICVGLEGEILVLDRPAGAGATILSASRPPLAVPFATDIEFLDGLLVVARLPGMDFRRFRIAPATITESSPLKAKGYDGRGTVITPNKQIGYWTAEGLRTAVAARVRYEKAGSVTTYRMDCGEFRMQWGRVFLDACIPSETGVTLRCIAADEPLDAEEVARSLPTNVVSTQGVTHPDLSPPMPPVISVSAAARVGVHRREAGRELPFTRRAATDAFETYEAPAMAGPGRYLWIVVELSGNTRFTPRIKSLRVEYPAHDLLRRLPKIYSRDSGAFLLQRYLALFDGMLGEMDVRATFRHVLLNPDSAPDGALIWLAGFLGLTLDERWSTPVRRTLIREAAWLFRFRGTVAGLTRFLTIVSGAPVLLVEKFRFRGITGVGDRGELANSILGAGFRVGGPIGELRPLEPEAVADDAFESHAHRFTVLIQALLSDEQLAMVRNVLEVHRPAHTLLEVCTAGSGIRVGRGLHVGLTAIIGRTAGFQTLQLGKSIIGRDGVIGRPQPGTILESGRAGMDSRVG